MAPHSHRLVWCGVLLGGVCHLWGELFPLLHAPQHPRLVSSSVLAISRAYKLILVILVSVSLSVSLT